LSLETDQIDLRGPGLEEACARIGGLFARSESRARAADYVQGLLSSIARKNSWQVAAHAGHTSPDGIQWLLTRAPWSANALRDITRSYVMEQLSDERAVVVYDDIGFTKRGDKSVGVARQRVGSNGRLENCQVGVFMAYVSAKGTALTDRELYLPRPEWAGDAARRRAAGVPPEVRYATKSQIATRMLARALATDVPIGSVVAGQSCAGAPIKEYCAARRLTLTEEISAQHPVADSRTDRPIAAAALGRLIPLAAFERGYPGGGSAATLRLGPPGIDGQQTSLLVRSRTTGHADCRYFLCHAPQWTPLGNLVTAADAHSNAREYVARSRIEAGLDQYEVRKWEPWYRHITLSMFAMAYLAVRRAEGVSTEQLPEVTSIPAPRTHRRAIRLRCPSQRIAVNSGYQTVGPAANY